jgi:uncharacterized C2H2 Zn-finger protein
MVQYKCTKCNKIFKKIDDYKKHKNRKTKCKNGSKNNKEVIHKCEKCKKTYSRKDSLTRHLKICKGNINIKNCKNVAAVIGNKNMTLIKSPININLIVFTKDGVKNISPKDLADILKSDKNIIENMISKVNLNPDKPEHHNIFYSDMKSSYGEVYENKKWVKKKIDEIINTLVDSKIEDLNEILNDMNDFLNKKTRNKIKESIEKVDYSKPGARKKLISYLKPILYNHKDMIIKTRKLTKEQEEDFFRKEQEKAEREEEELNRQYAEQHKPNNKKIKKKSNDNISDKEFDDDSDNDSDNDFDDKLDDDDSDN